MNPDRMEKGIIFDIKRYAIHDGPGIRTTVFLKGCPAGCWWCHNPESQLPQIQSIAGVNRFDDRTFCEERPVGKLMSASEVISEVLRDRIFFEESDGGVTYSGGEPLFQPDFLFALLSKSKQQGLHTVLDTSGFAEPDTFRSVADLVDLFLYDIKFINDDLHVKYTGVSNRAILANLIWLAGQEKRFRLRFPLIPGVTATRQNVREITAFINRLELAEPLIDILPYHKIAGHKYKKLNMPNRMKGQVMISDALMQEIRSGMESHGMNVNIGG